ncbi:GNAT family protein [Sporolactobacillus sp. STCC-11]|uniref:GNAT family N-acetyltransferase n=1 Tax=Sporolactobacillus caesalpiniae TaxID=3230362 RepID=UPI0033990CF3
MLRIREIHEQEAERLFNLYHEIHSETYELGFEPGNGRVETLASELHRTTQSKSAYFIGMFESADIGFAVLKGHTSREMAHLAHISIGLCRNWRGKGYGKKMLNSVEKWALAHQLRRIEACIGLDNRPALFLFGASGYRVEGIRKSAFIKDGMMTDGFYMAKILKENEEDNRIKELLC